MTAAESAAPDHPTPSSDGDWRLFRGDGASHAVAFPPARHGADSPHRSLTACEPRAPAHT
jgi:hypothetical protein